MKWTPAFKDEGGLHSVESKFFNQVIMNEGTLSAIVEHYIDCSYIFSILMFHLY